MRIFLAGASGVLGVRLVPLLVTHGHVVVGMTRTPEKADLLRSLGADPVICDVYDADALTDAVVACQADAIVDLLTDLPDDEDSIPKFEAANARMRRDGTRNLLAAAGATGTSRFVAQSLAWELGGDAGVRCTSTNGPCSGPGVWCSATASSSGRGPTSRTKRRRRRASTWMRRPAERFRRSKPRPG